MDDIIQQMGELSQAFHDHCARLDIHGSIYCYAGTSEAEDTWQIYLSFPGDGKYSGKHDPSMGIHSGATLTEAMGNAVALLETKN